MMPAERGCRNQFPFLRLIREGKKARPAACRKENARSCERGRKTEERIFLKAGPSRRTMR